MLGHNVISDCKLTLDLYLKERHESFHILQFKILAEGKALFWIKPVIYCSCEVILGVRVSRNKSPVHFLHRQHQVTEIGGTMEAWKDKKFYWLTQKTHVQNMYTTVFKNNGCSIKKSRMYETMHIKT